MEWAPTNPACIAWLQQYQSIPALALKEFFFFVERLALR